MKKKILAALCLSAGMIATHTHAGEGFYIKGAFGNTDFEELESDQTIVLSAGYQFNDYIAIDVSHTNYGEVDLSDSDFSSTLETTGLAVAAVLSLPVHENFAFYSKLGLANWTTDIDVTIRDDFFGDTFNASLESDGTVLVAGIGLEAIFNDTISATLEYEVITIDPVEVDADLDTLALGIKVTF